MTDIGKLLGSEGKSLLEHVCRTIGKEQLLLPGPDYVERALLPSDRPVPVLRNLQAVLDHGRLGGTGYLSILPVDQGIEHSAGASFAPNPSYFDPENIVRLAVEGAATRWPRPSVCSARWRAGGRTASPSSSRSITTSS